MNKLKDILQKLEGVRYELIGPTNARITGIAIDSRKVKAGFAFAAFSGTQADGRLFIEKAIEAGAKVVITNEKPASPIEDITYVITEDTVDFTGKLTAEFFGHPTRKLDLVGVTGTNGKTTTTTLLYNLFRKSGFKCGLIGTTGILIEDRQLPTQNTTPDIITLNQVLVEMADADCDYVFMEVSSHAVVQNRIAGLEFKGGIFTNLTHDHLDYHKTFEAYRDAKKQFFDSLSSDAFALMNADDKNGKFMLQNTRAVRVTYGIKNNADFKGKIIEFDLHGMEIEIEGERIYTRLSGMFNAYNLLAVYSAAKMLDLPTNELLKQISSLEAPEGRFSLVQYDDITGVVDYAHTPDALQNVLESIREINIRATKIITVVGCGGDRDKTKRPQMARIAVELSDQVILTSDNPRSENPETIIEEMEAGVPYSQKHKMLKISDRKEAIKAACRFAGKGDIILVAGKGHEKYQEIKGVKYPFNDKQVLTEQLKQMKA